MSPAYMRIKRKLQSGNRATVSLTAKQGANMSTVLAVIFLLISMFFVYRSFYGMRIKQGGE